MDELVKEFEQKIAAAREGGGPKAAERMKTKGKLLPRERYAPTTWLVQLTDHKLMQSLRRILGWLKSWTLAHLSLNFLP